MGADERIDRASRRSAPKGCFLTRFQGKRKGEEVIPEEPDFMKDCVAEFLTNSRGVIFSSDGDVDTISERAKYVALEYRRLGLDADTAREKIIHWLGGLGLGQKRINAGARYVDWLYEHNTKPLGCAKTGALRTRGFCLLDHGQSCRYQNAQTRLWKMGKHYPEEAFDEYRWESFLLQHHGGLGYRAARLYRIYRTLERAQGKPLAIGFRALARVLAAQDKSYHPTKAPMDIVRAIQLLERYGLIRKTESGKSGPRSSRANMYVRILPIPPPPVPIHNTE